MRHYDSGYHAWQYPDWLFAGDDLIVVSRTAWGGSHRAADIAVLIVYLAAVVAFGCLRIHNCAWRADRWAGAGGQWRRWRR